MLCAFKCWIIHFGSMSLSPLMLQLNTARISLLHYFFLINNTHTLFWYRYGSTQVALCPLTHTWLRTFMHVFICAHVYHFLIMLIVAEPGMCIHPDGQNHLLPTRTLNLILRVMDLISQWTKSIILWHAWAHGRLFGYSVTLSQALTACNYRARHRNWYIFIVV